MSSPDFIFTTSPFSKDDIPLASLVPDRSTPSTDALIPYKVTDSEYSKNPDKNFDGKIYAATKNWFQLLISRFLSFVLKSEKSAMFHVSAAEGSIYMLRQPRDIFKKIASEDKVKEFLEEQYVDKQDTWFVIGYRTFVNAKLYREHRKAHEASANAKAPISEVVGDPSGTADAEGEAGHEDLEEVAGDTETTGERIYAICYRKVRITFHKQMIEVKLLRGNQWEPFAKTRGDDVIDEYLEANLDEEADVEQFHIHKGQTEAGESVIFGVPKIM